MQLANNFLLCTCLSEPYVLVICSLSAEVFNFGVNDLSSLMVHLCELDQGCLLLLLELEQFVIRLGMDIAGLLVRLFQLGLHELREEFYKRVALDVEK